MSCQCSYRHVITGVMRRWPRLFATDAGDAGVTRLQSPMSKTARKRLAQLTAGTQRLNATMLNGERGSRPWPKLKPVAIIAGRRQIDCQ